MRSAHAGVHVALFATALAWGLNISAVKALTEQVDLMLVASLRTVLASAALTLVLLVMEREALRWSLRFVAIALGAAALMVYANQTLFAHAMHQTSATNAALIMALAPLVSALLEAALFRRPLASLQFFDEPVGMALSGGAHVAARFMLAAEPFHGIRDVDELRFVLSGYDEGTEWPEHSGLSFTAGLASAAWAQGFRMADRAPALMQAMHKELPHATTTRADAAPSRRAGSGLAPAPQPRRSGGYWDGDPATFAYRGMLRHLRRHVARYADRIVREFMGHPDPIRIAERLRSSAAARAAFAEMLWCERQEPQANNRRWPYRRAADTPGGRRDSAIEMPARRRRPASLTRATARPRTRSGGRAPNSGDRSASSAWRSRRRSTGPCREPARRGDADATRRQRTIEQAFSGPCLAHDATEGWSVRPSLCPSRSRVDRRRLLGLWRRRLEFWLCQAGRQFVARASDVKLQVVAETPPEAIEALRQAMRQHRRRYFVVSVDGAPLPPRMRPQPAADPASAAYELRISRVLREYGFWEGAEAFYAEAVRFTALPGRQRPVEPAGAVTLG